MIDSLIDLAGESLVSKPPFVKRVRYAMFPDHGVFTQLTREQILKNRKLLSR